MENIILNIDSEFRNMEHYPNSGYFSYKFKESIKNISLNCFKRINTIFQPSQND